MKKYAILPCRRRMLTKNMITDSQENTKSAAEASRWLGVSYNTYKKWAIYYGVFENHKNQYLHTKMSRFRNTKIN